MAEGGTLAKSIDGSDFMFEFVCTPCAVDGKMLEAVQFCQNCVQYLCTKCLKCHELFSKNHRLKPASKQVQNWNPQVDTKTTTVVAKCLSHPDRDIEMYCGTHDMVYCSLCITKEHRSCKSVVEIEDGVHKPDVNKLQQLVAEFDRLTKELRGTKDDKSAHLGVMKTKKDNLLKEIATLRKEMNEHLDQLELKVRAELDEVLIELENELKDDITAANEMLTCVTERNSDLKVINDAKYNFVAEKMGRKLVSDVHAFLENTKLSYKHLKFERNQVLYDCLKMADNIGEIKQNSTVHKQYVIRSCDQTNIRVDTDRKKCLVDSMCHLPDGTIIIADSRNKRLKRLGDQLDVKDVCDLQQKPLGLCSNSATEIAVRCSKTLQFIHVGQIQTMGQNFAMKRVSTHFVLGNILTSFADTLWTVSENSLLIYSLSGSLVKTIDKDSQGRKIFPIFSPEGICVSNDGTRVYAAAWEDRIIVFNNNGNVINEMHDQRLKGTCGLCVTDDDIVFVSGFNSKNVVMFDAKGYCLGELVDSKDMLKNPLSLLYDKKKSRLLVGYGTDIIQIFELDKE